MKTIRAYIVCDKGGDPIGPTLAPSRDGCIRRFSEYAAVGWDTARKSGSTIEQCRVEIGIPRALHANAAGLLAAAEAALDARDAGDYYNDTIFDKLRAAIKAAKGA